MGDAAMRRARELYIEACTKHYRERVEAARPGKFKHAAQAQLQRAQETYGAHFDEQVSKAEADNG
jgi:hypothetical protein